MPDPYQPDAETPDAGSYASPFASIDLNRTPLAGGLPNIDPPDPANPHLDGGQVLYHMALGAKPEDFHPALQPLAQGYSIAFQPKPEMGPGLLGSLEDIRNSITAGAPDPDGQAGDNDPSKGQEPTEVGIQDIAAKIRQRDIDYLDRYYDAVSKYANQYNVHPALPLGLGIESTFGNGGTYRKTGDAFGMTGGSTAHMTHASSPEENARQLFDLYGRQMYGVGDDADAFINAMQGRDSQGQPVAGWRTYNSENPKTWEDMAKNGIAQMRRDLPVYLRTRKTKAKVGT